MTAIHIGTPIDRCVRMHCPTNSPQLRDTLSNSGFDAHGSARRTQRPGSAGNTCRWAPARAYASEITSGCCRPPWRWPPSSGEPKSIPYELTSRWPYRSPSSPQRRYRPECSAVSGSRGTAVNPDGPTDRQRRYPRIARPLGSFEPNRCGTSPRGNEPRSFPRAAISLPTEQQQRSFDVADGGLRVSGRAMSAVEKASTAKKSITRSRGRHRRHATPRSVLWLRTGAVAPDSASPADSSPAGSVSMPTSSKSPQSAPHNKSRAVDDPAATASVASSSVSIAGRRAAGPPKDTVGPTNPSGDPTTGPPVVVNTPGGQTNSTTSPNIGTAGSSAIAAQGSADMPAGVTTPAKVTGRLLASTTVVPNPITANTSAPSVPADARIPALLLPHPARRELTLSTANSVEKVKTNAVDASVVDLTGWRFVRRAVHR